MENPQPFAGSHVESAHVAFVIAHALRRHAFAESRADNYGVFRNHGRGLDANFSGRQIRKNVLIVIQLQVHFAVIGE